MDWGVGVQVVVGSWPVNGTEEESTNYNLEMRNLGLVGVEGFCGAVVLNFSASLTGWLPAGPHLF